MHTFCVAFVGTVRDTGRQGQGAHREKVRSTSTRLWNEVFLHGKEKTRSVDARHEAVEHQEGWRDTERERDL